MPNSVGIPLVSAALLTLAASWAAFAQDDVLPDFQKRIYINGGVGVTEIEPESPTDALTVSDNTDTGFHLALGYDINRFLSLEGYVADLGTAQIAFLGDDIGSIDYRVFGISALGYLFNSRSGATFRDSDLDGAFRREGLSIYGRLGLGSLNNSSEGVDFFQDHTSHAAFGLGLEYGFRNGFALRAEAMAFDTDAAYLNVGILKRFGKSHVPAALATPAVVVSEPAPKVVEIVTPAPLPIPLPLPVEVPVLPDPIEIPGGNYAFDRVDIMPQFARDLDDLAAVLIKNDIGIYISGHADWIGSDQYNLGLSERRAAGVKMYLQNRGVAAQLLETRAYGESRPIADNTTDSGRAMNRRVEIELQ